MTETMTGARLSRRRALSGLVATAIVWVGCTTELSRDNPYDPAAPADQQARGRITGVAMLEGRDEHAGIRVRLEGLSTAPATTDADGRYTISDVPAGTYVVVAELPSSRLYLPTRAPEPVALGVGVEARAPDLLLRRPPDPPALRDAESVGNDTIVVRWAPLEASDLASYHVYARTPDAPVFSWVGEAGAGASELSIGSLSRDTVYDFSLAAVDADGLESSLSLGQLRHFVQPEHVRDIALEGEGLGGRLKPAFTTLSHDGNTLYALSLNGRLARVDLTTDPLTPHYDDLLVDGAAGLAVLPNGELLTAAYDNDSGPELLRLDSSSLQEREEASVNLGVGIPSSVAVSADGTLALVGLKAGLKASVVKVHLSADQHSTETILESLTSVTDVLVQGRVAYVVDQGASLLWKVDLNESPLAPASIPVGAGPMRVAWWARVEEPDQERLIVTNGQGHSVSIVDVDTFEEIARPAVGRGPEGVTVRGNLAFVANNLSNDISLVSVAQLQSLRCSTPCPIATPSGPTAIAAPNSAERFYVANLDAGSVSVFSYAEP